MCLGIPGRITAISRPEDRLALVDVLGVEQEVNIACVLREEPPEACLGAWVLVHKGFAMSRVDEREAQLTLLLLRELAAAQAELDASRLRPAGHGPGRAG